MAWRQLSTSSLYRQHFDYIRYTCKLQGVSRSFFRKIFSFFHFPDPQNPPYTRICNLSTYTRRPVCPPFAHVRPFRPCHLHFLHFAFRNPLIFLRLRRILFIRIRVYLLTRYQICGFFDERSDFCIHDCMLPARFFRTRKAPDFSPDACLNCVMNLSIMVAADNVRLLRTGRNPSVHPPAPPDDSAHMSHCCRC